MRKGLIALLLGIALLGAPVLSGKARALSCEQRLDDYALVVLGRIQSARPIPGEKPKVVQLPSADGRLLIRLLEPYVASTEVTMEVDRYLKGEGPPTLTFVYTYSGYRRVTASGLQVYIGLDYSPEDQRYTASDCSLLISATTRDEGEQWTLRRLHDMYGRGRRPVQPLRGQGLLWGSMGALAAMVGAAHTRRGRLRGPAAGSAARRRARPPSG